MNDAKTKWKMGRLILGGLSMFCLLRAGGDQKQFTLKISGFIEQIRHDVRDTLAGKSCHFLFPQLADLVNFFNQKYCDQVLKQLVLTGKEIFVIQNMQNTIGKPFVQMKQRDEKRKAAAEKIKKEKQKLYSPAAYLADLDKDNSDVLLISFGSVGYENQEVPYFFEKLVKKFQKKSFSIFCSGEPLQESVLFTQETEKHERQFNREFQHLEGVVFKNQKYNLTLHEYKTLLPLGGSSEDGQFKDALKIILKNKLEQGKIVIIGNNTAPSFKDIPSVAGIYAGLKQETHADNLQLYSQAGESECVSYDPLLFARGSLPISERDSLTIYNDLKGYYWLASIEARKYGAPGRPCTLCSGKNFTATDFSIADVMQTDLLFEYNLGEDEKDALFVAYVSGVPVEPVLPLHWQNLEGILEKMDAQQREAYLIHTNAVARFKKYEAYLNRAAEAQRKPAAAAVGAQVIAAQKPLAVAIPAIVRPAGIQDDQWIAFSSVRDEIVRLANTDEFPSIYEKKCILEALEVIQAAVSVDAQSFTTNQPMAEILLNLLKGSSQNVKFDEYFASFLLPIWYLRDLRNDQSDFILLNFEALGNEYQEVPRFIQKLVQQFPEKNFTILGIGNSDSAIGGQNVQRGFCKDFEEIESFPLDKSSYKLFKNKNNNLSLYVYKDVLSQLQKNVEFMHEVLNVLLQKCDGHKVIIIGNHAPDKFVNLQDLERLYVGLRQKVMPTHDWGNIQMYWQTGKSECVVYNPLIFPYDDSSLYKDINGFYTDKSYKNAICLLLNGDDFYQEDQTIFSKKNVEVGGLHAGQKLSCNYVLGHFNGALRLFGVYGNPATLNDLAEQSKSVFKKSVVALEGAVREQYLGKETLAKLRLQDYLGSIVLDLSKDSSFDNKRCEEKFDEQSGQVKYTAVDINSQLFTDGPKRGFFVMQLPALNQYEWWQITKDDFQKKPTNYCGYYAAFHAVEMQNNLQEEKEIFSVDSLLRMAREGQYNDAPSHRELFISTLKPLLEKVSRFPGGLKTPPYDNLTNEQIVRCLEAVDMEKQIGVVAPQESLSKSLFQDILPSLNDFMLKTRNFVVLVLNVQAAHWIAVGIVRISGKLAFLVSDSLGNINWQSTEGLNRLESLHALITKGLQ